MMQLVCNNVALDLYDNAGLQFKHENPLFAFDNISCERTTQFKLPRTKTNDDVFSLSRVPAYRGEGMRRKFSAQLQSGAVVQDGYLYISDYDGNDYTAIFVTGEMIDLQTIRDAGKLKDWYHPGGYVEWSNANVKDANTYDGQLSLAIPRYKSNDAPCHPSFDLSDLMDNAYFSLTGKHITVARQRGFRLIPKNMPTLPKMSVEIQYAGTGVDYSDSDEPTDYANTMSISDATQIIQQQDLVLLIGVGGQPKQYKYLKLHQFIAKQNIVMTFPSDFPVDYYLMSIEDKGVDGSDPLYNWLSQSWFMGDYYFTHKSGGGTESFGTPLAGRSIEIPSGTPFMILSRDAYEYEPAPLNWSGFRWINDEFYTYDLKDIIVEGEKIEINDTIRAVDLLPDLTLIELFKIYSYCVGKVLMYDEANGVTFDDLNFSTWPVVHITDYITKKKEVKRTFGNYVQHNYVQLKSGKDVPDNQRIITEYTIDNDNLELSNVIGEIPYSEGSLDVDSGYIVARFDAEDVEKHSLYENGIMFAGAAKYGLRISLPNNAGLQALCDKSTQIKVTARLNLMEYTNITPKTILQVDGQQYVWTSRTWQGDTAEFTLAKI